MPFSTPTGDVAPGPMVAFEKSSTIRRSLRARVSPLSIRTSNGDGRDSMMITRVERAVGLVADALDAAGPFAVAAGWRRRCSATRSPTVTATAARAAPSHGSSALPILPWSSPPRTASASACSSFSASSGRHPRRRRWRGARASTADGRGANSPSWVPRPRLPGCDRVPPASERARRVRASPEAPRPLHHRGRQPRQPRHLDAVAPVGRARNDAAQEDDLVVPLRDRDRQVAHARRARRASAVSSW